MRISNCMGGKGSGGNRGALGGGGGEVVKGKGNPFEVFAYLFGNSTLCRRAYWGVATRLRPAVIPSVVEGRGTTPGKSGKATSIPDFFHAVGESPPDFVPLSSRA